MNSDLTRRTWNKLICRLACLPAARLFVTPTSAQSRSRIEKLNVGLIGAGWLPGIKRQGRGIAIGREVLPHAELVAICEVDNIAAEFANKTLTQGKARLFHDYRDLLRQPDIDAVLIATPDHWHARMAIDAMQAAKDVYVEKPATVTISEGQELVRVARATGRIVQVGTQQRTEVGGRFAQAKAIVQAGRIGQLQEVQIGVDSGLTGGPFMATAPPATLDWNLWQGPVAETDYMKERTHWTFRWWYEYAGGKITDWGAHHVDIAQWVMEADSTGPVQVAGQGRFQIPYENGYPTRNDFYNTPVEFSVNARFASGVNMSITNGANGITFVGTAGRIFVNRARLTGKPVEDLQQNPLPADAIEKIYQGPRPASHMANFIDCVRTRQQPVSDIESHQRTITTCHLANLALRLARPLQWNPDNEQFIDDQQAAAFISREQRTGF